MAKAPSGSPDATCVCGTCISYLCASGVGYCRFDPPRVGSRVEFGPEGRYPSVSADDWCSHYKRPVGRPRKESDNAV